MGGIGSRIAVSPTDPYTLSGIARVSPSNSDLEETPAELLERVKARPPYKPYWFVGASLAELRDMPVAVQRALGTAIRAAQGGAAHPNAKPYTTKEHKGRSVMEVVEDHDGDTFRLVYTVHFDDVVFVLCAFQKKSKKGIATPKLDKALIESRYRLAKRIHDAPPDDLRARMQQYREQVTRRSAPDTATNRRKRS